MSCSGGTQTPELEDRDNGQNEPPVILRKMVRGLLHHLDRCESTGLDGIHLNVLIELRKVLIEQPSAIHILYKQTDGAIA